MTIAAPCYLVEILLPTETGNGKPVDPRWFESLLKELTAEFGGATSFLRAPGQGLWRDGSQTQRDNIAVIEVMVMQIQPRFWQVLRERMERELCQREIVIRARKIRRL